MSTALMPSCLKCRYRQRNFRARSDSWCVQHDMIIYDTLGTVCPQFESEKQPELMESLAQAHVDQPGMYVWLLFFQEGEPPYYHELARLTDYGSYAAYKSAEAMQAQQALHATMKAEKEGR